ncbi:hypothetical protein EDD18DRAFT_1105616 [Armillaria luteobubalina]|uniref:CxC2-like cysteine cluster KDZ transposase-associated domain-containing protein n=1 Tax=Armillaria luteobubalina TaxID=153913 RepID=A0AA39Q7C6_9AGAR|nr:hypothetical protein EDD18DRAFT_1105616 [Armillaria luteobubalina]
MSGAASLGLQNLFISYDITCQWNINFKTRMKELPSDLRLRNDIGLSCGVPKLHAKAHKMACQCEYAIGIQSGTGRTDSEGIKWTWVVVNAIVWSTKEMGLGSRHDTLDDHFAYHNFVKLIGLGDMLHKKLTEAECQVVAYRKYHSNFTRALPKPEYAKEWMAVVEEWDRDQSKPSPYLLVAEHITEQDLKLKLKEDERCAKACGEIPIHKISTTSCLGLGLLIEDSQYMILSVWQPLRELQIVYMPGIALRIEQEWETAMTTIEAEDDKLWFPSDLSKVVCDSICHLGLGEKENVLREAQCWDALAAICSSLRAEASIHAFWNEHLQGQEALSHASDVLDNWRAKQNLAAQKYRQARNAMLTLQGPGPWMNDLRELTAKDMLSMYGSVMDIQELATEVTNPEDQHQKKRKSEKHKDKPRDVSWIWLAEGSLGELGNDSDITDVRVHWLRSWACLLRWEEEISLLREEQRRVLVTLRYCAKWWDKWRSGWNGLAAEIAEGVQAYAAQQRDGQLDLAEHFARKWPSEYRALVDNDEESDDDVL